MGCPGRGRLAQGLKVRQQRSWQRKRGPGLGMQDRTGPTRRMCARHQGPYRDSMSCLHWVGLSGCREACERPRAGARKPGKARTRLQPTRSWGGAGLWPHRQRCTDSTPSLVASLPTAWPSFQLRPGVPRPRLSTPSHTAHLPSHDSPTRPARRRGPVTCHPHP